MTPEHTLKWILDLLEQESARHGLKGVLGVAVYKSVHDALLPVQQELLRDLSGDRFDALMDAGSFISIAFAYPEEAIDAIAVERDGQYDKDLWNFYGAEYDRLNDALNQTAARLAVEVGGFSIPATTSGLASVIDHVEGYWPQVVSHRVAAELSGVGWRGRNELIVNPLYSCAIRLASIATELPLPRSTPVEDGCGECRACLDACPFLANKDRLKNYREQCRRYLVALGLESEVCGKCIRACYRESVHRDSFRL